MDWKTILRFKVIGVVLVLTLLQIPVGYVAATDSQWNADYYDLIVDPIKTDAGYVSGTMNDVIDRCWIYIPTFTLQCSPTLLGEPGEAVRIYRGIPYAAPPVGNLRWKPPQPVAPWEGIRECTEFTPMAPQPFQPPNPFWGSIPESGMSEDCLYLNIATPAKYKNERLPVMVFFHGGGISSGTNSPDGVGNYVGAAGGYLAAPLPRHGVVIVTVQHRLGPIGYMCHPALRAESGNTLCGNYGYLDLIAALRWVQSNIAAFGGDPHNVTIFGESGGGNKVNELMASPLATGLFQRAKSQSGWNAPFNGTLLSTAEGYGVSLAAQLGITDTGAAGLAALRAQSWQNIITAANAPSTAYVDVPTVDGYFITDTLTNIFSEGKQNDVPYIVSIVGGDIPEVFTSTVAAVPIIKQKSPIYAYVFTQVPDGWKALGIDAWHGSDVAAEFGDTVALKLFVGALLPITLTADPGVTYKDVWVADYMMSMLAQFARTGNPSGVMGVYWPAYNINTDQYLNIGYKPLLESGFSKLVEPVPPH